MAETSFEVKYDGPALQSGRMPVNQLAPALLSLGQLFTEASRLLNPESDPVSLEIQATKEGSFEVELILHAAELGWDQMSTLSPGEALTSLVVFKEFVIGGSIDMSLMGLLRRLKGRRITDETEGQEPGQIVIHVDDLTIVVPEEVARLNRSIEIRRKAREVVEPLRSDGIDALEFRSDDEPTVELQEEDIPAFDLPEDDGMEMISEQEIDAYLDVISPTFEEGNKWRFGGLGSKFNAAINDPEFQQAVASHEELFGAGDQLRGRLQIIQRRDPATGKTKTERQVVKVYETIPAPKQSTLQEDAEGKFEDPS